MIKKFKFTLSTNRLMSEVKKVVEIEVSDDATEDEINDVVNEVYFEWLSDQNCGGYEEII